MKAILLISLLFSASIKAELWNPTLKEANKIAKKALEDKSFKSLRKLIKKKNLNPDFAFNSEYRDDKRANVTISMAFNSVATVEANENGGIYSGYYYEGMKELYSKLGADPNYVFKSALWGGMTPLKKATQPILLKFLVNEAGADPNFFVNNSRGEPDKAINFIGTSTNLTDVIRFKTLIELGTNLKDELECNTFNTINEIYNEQFRDENKEKARIVFRDSFLKHFDLDKKYYYECTDFILGPVCELAPDICDEAYTEIMAE